MKSWDDYVGDYTQALVTDRRNEGAAYLDRAAELGGEQTAIMRAGSTGSFWGDIVRYNEVAQLGNEAQSAATQGAVRYYTAPVTGRSDRVIGYNGTEAAIVFGTVALPAAAAARSGGGTSTVRGVPKQFERIGDPPPGSASYARPSGFRKGVREQVWEGAKGPDGLVRNPGTGEVMQFDQAWDMGHKPGYEFRKYQQSAIERGISRQQFLDEHNNPSHYRPEIPSYNRSHQGENLTDDYFGD